MGSVEVLGSSIHFSLPACLLTLLLFNAGLGIEPRCLSDLVYSHGILLIGLIANLVVPLLFIGLIAISLIFWPDPIEVQYILVGLALIASMPVAGSSSAWVQNANGDLALSLGLVLGSTLLSPLTTPMVLNTVSWLTEGTFADSLHQLAESGTSLFLIVFVMVPSMAGILIRCAIRTDWMQKIKPYLKMVNSCVLIVLCYSNAAVALPKIIAQPDWDFLAVLLIIVTGLCSFGFVAGFALSRRFGADSKQRIALMFGLGMNNNGTGLVLASSVMAEFPEVLLPIIFYNLIQHLVAAGCKQWFISSAVASDQQKIRAFLCLQETNRETE
ncbi:MAG: bile acid:sodium symporter [Gemmataceae bacterium]|nr:bile acid:sodium symporter [Gemmataceae bacterium]